jgi:putative transposase
MARPLRISEPGIPLHIVQRGNNRVACFLTDDDRLFYLEQLTRHAEAAGCAVHAYVLMSNHVHLLVSPVDDAGSSRLMQNLGRSFVQAF